MTRREEHKRRPDDQAAIDQSVTGASLEVRGVKKVYQRGTPVRALAGVSLSIDSGSYTAIMGPSGSGKTTLLNLLGALDVPTDGTLLFDGRDLGTMNDRQRATLRGRAIGFVFQTFNLMPRLTARENIALPLVYADVPRAARRRRARALLDRFGMADRGDHRPAALSGGQRQRVAIARALACAPRLVLADEPTGNLDTTTGGRIMDAIESLREDGTTVVIITHERAVADRANRIVRIRDGVLAGSNDPDGPTTT